MDQLKDRIAIVPPLCAAADPVNLPAPVLPIAAPEAPPPAPIEDDDDYDRHLDYEAPAPVLDAHGFLPAEYEWVPRPRRVRRDGWTAAKQRQFIETLADTGQVIAAARHVDMSLASCYRLRREPGGHGFAAAWDAAIQQASLKLVDVAFDRAFNGVEDIVFDRDGRRVACRYRYNDRLLMFLLRAHQPERYRLAHRIDRARDEPPPPPVLPVAEALSRIEPAVPPEPHRLLAPDRLEEELGVAHDLAEIAARYPRDDREEFRDPWRPQHYEDEPQPAEDPDADPADAPPGDELERKLAWAKLGLDAPDDDSWPPDPVWEYDEEEEG